MRLAGAEFFADWRDSDRARSAKEDGARFAEEQGSKVMEENDGACDHPGTQ